MPNKNFYTRRHFLQNSILFSASLLTTLASSRLANARDESVEAIVIGSGFGGGIAALRLGQNGIKTVVLERGRRWLITPAQNTFATLRNPDGRSAWLSPTTVVFERVPIDIYTGILELKRANRLSILSGAGVGGGSLVYNGFIYQPPANLFYQVFPRAIDYDELASVYYPRVNSIIKASPIPPDILATDYYLSTRIFLERGANAGLPTVLQNIAVDWDIVRQEINGTKVPSVILGESWTGVNSGALTGTDRTYIAQAEETGNVEVLPLHVVTAISEVPGHGYRVACNQINESGEIIRTKTMTCRYLFLAAGSMGTSELLVKAKATGTLPRLNDQIGLGWAGNADIGGLTSGLEEPTNPSLGGPSTAVIQYFDNPYGPVSFDVYPYPNLPQGNQTSVAIPIPSVRGKFQYNSKTGQVQLDWPGRDPKALKAAEFGYRVLDRKNTGTSIAKRDITTELDDSSTVHPLGGAVMGKACDLYGRAFGYRGLYVVDGALVPGSTGCTNPSFTIAALAERCMDRILAEDIL